MVINITIKPHFRFLSLAIIKTQLKGHLEVRKKDLVAAIREDLVRSENLERKVFLVWKEELFWEGIKGRTLVFKGRPIIQTLGKGIPS